MARRSSPDRGLDEAQVEQMRVRVAAGGRPRVRLSGPQFDADATGTVVRVGDRAVDGEDFITVRARIAGVVDELAFAPGELSGTGRAPTPPPPPPKPPRRQRATARPAEPTAPEPTAPAVVAPARPERTKPTRRPRTAAYAPVTITVRSAGSTWSVTVQRGARSVVKNADLPPGAVTAIAALLDQPGADEAVAAVNDSARGAAEERAALLRAELAQVQAVLDSHRRP